MDKIRGQFIVWFHWERRAEELAAALGYPVRFFPDVVRSKRVPWPLRLPVNYFWKALSTWFLLFRKRPRVVVAQSPPALCSMVCRVYCALAGARLVVDGHNGAYMRPWTSVPGYKNTLERAHAVFVHNPELCQAVQPMFPHARLRVLYDRIPERTSTASPASKAGKYFLVVCSYDPDEPIAEMLAAAQAFVQRHSPDLQFRFTGDSRKKADVCAPYANVPGIVFTGFLSRADYDAMLQGAFGVLCLSTDDNVQQCGSIEAMAVGVPVVISDSQTNRTLFPRGALLAATERASILEKFEEFVPRRDTLAEEIESLRRQRIQDWWKNFEVLRAELDL